ncbi:flagellin [Brachyspira sp. G79]|uniref:flagellin N-terminal helical domain-containing protein n=1 Tax=Brachyspira sp. G79 TaxID=1358104 RepID=UPI000BBC6F0E|nr:flagellin [Brachyspira sp. G79]PCG19375.1 flagellin [Brachyspira sp. G79]
MIITNNLNAITANRFLKVNANDSRKKFPKLFASEKGPLVQARYLMRAEKNTQDGISFVQTADGYIEETMSILQRIRELSIKASNGVYSNTDRLYMQTEVSGLIDEIDKIASQAQFNTLKIFTGRFSNSVNASASMWIHIGAGRYQRKRVYIATITANSLKLKNELNSYISISSVSKANKSIGVIDEAIKYVIKQRADLGAYQNRFDEYTHGLMLYYENMVSYGSKKMDKDIAEASIYETISSIKSQAALAMIIHSNNSPKNALILLQ